MLEPTAPAISTTLQDIDGNFSSKRVAAFIALACYIAGAIMDTVTRHQVPSEVMQGFLWITLGGLGLAVGERFAPRYMEGHDARP